MLDAALTVAAEKSEANMLSGRRRPTAKPDDGQQAATSRMENLSDRSGQKPQGFATRNIGHSKGQQDRIHILQIFTVQRCLTSSIAKWITFFEPHSALGEHCIQRPAENC